MQQVIVAVAVTGALIERAGPASLFAILHGLKARGLAIVFISHRFQEIIAHCDRGTILHRADAKAEFRQVPSPVHATLTAVAEALRLMELAQECLQDNRPAEALEWAVTRGARSGPAARW